MTEFVVSFSIYFSRGFFFRLFEFGRLAHNTPFTGTLVIFVSFYLEGFQQKREYWVFSIHSCSRTESFPRGLSFTLSGDIREPDQYLTHRRIQSLLVQPDCDCLN